VRLSREGELLVLGADGLIQEYTWEGDLIRTLPLLDEKDFPHHDLIRLSNGNRLLLARREGPGADYLLEVDLDGRPVWEWRAFDYRKSFAGWDYDRNNPTHINSVRELPPNRWFDAGDHRFRPGNILVSARNLNTIFVIERSSGEVVWQYSDGLDGQHEAIMLEEPHEHAGRIIVFNNGLDNLRDYRRTRVQIIDPRTGDLVWQYGAKFFFSDTGGVAQPLESGNVLITSSQGGRVFEVTPDKEVVWEWTPKHGHLPMRIERLAYDHSPQLAALRPELEVRVTPEDLEPWVSPGLYDLGAAYNDSKVRIGGRVRRIMRWRNGCGGLVIPPRATMQIAYGFDPKRLPELPGSARFQLTLASGGRTSTLLDELLETDSKKLWHRQRFDLGEYAFESLELCLSIQRESGPADVETAGVWQTPMIRSADRAQDEEGEEATSLTEEELGLRRRQLEALGYVD
jgi:hypothetical protein